MAKDRSTQAWMGDAPVLMEKDNLYMELLIGPFDTADEAVEKTEMLRDRLNELLAEIMESD